MIQIEVERSGATVSSAARSKLYLLLADSFKYPASGFVELVRDGTFIQGTRKVSENLPYSLPLPTDSLGGKLLQSVSQDDIEAEFIRVFDIGPGSPPCALREGQYHGSRMSIMEGLVRFYNHFGLSTSVSRDQERADSLCTELEFLHYLTFKEVLAIDNDRDPSPYRRAQRDFLKRHPATWIPMLRARLDQLIEGNFEKLNGNVLLFYAGLIELAEEFTIRDLEYVTATCDSHE